MNLFWYCSSSVLRNCVCYFLNIINIMKGSTFQDRHDNKEKSNNHLMNTLFVSCSIELFTCLHFPIGIGANILIVKHTWVDTPAQLNIDFPETVNSERQKACRSLRVLSTKWYVIIYCAAEPLCNWEVGNVLTSFAQRIAYPSAAFVIVSSLMRAAYFPHPGRQRGSFSPIVASKVLLVISPLHCFDCINYPSYSTFSNCAGN